MTNLFTTLIPYILWLVAILLLVPIFFILRSPKISFILKIILTSILLISSVVMINALWFERYYIRVTNHTISGYNVNKKIALVSDIHAGVWKDKNFVKSMVDKTNSIPDLDMVLIAGDWTYKPEKTNLNDLFAPLADIKVPVYGVLGNHDLEKPGEPLESELRQALTKANVTLIDNTVLSLGGLNVVGLGDNWADQDDVRILDTVNFDQPTVILAHNPDSTLKYPEALRKRIKNDNLSVLTLTGHTHCGQVRIPFVYKTQLPVKDKYYDMGWYSDKNQTGFFGSLPESEINKTGNNLFISCGVGESVVPLRLFNQATIDVFDLKA